jgi:hypothetical protein
MKMSQENPTPEAAPPATSSKLTLNDPVEPETLAKFGELQTARMQACERYTDLELEKVRTLRAVASIDAERQRLFEAVLVSRGLAPNATVEIDAKTGLVKVVDPTQPPPAG